MSKTSIEWATHVWNPLAAFDRETGKRGWFCTRVSDGCKNCYAAVINKRLGNGHDYQLRNLSKIEWRLVNLDAPLRARKPRRYFVTSMSDLFQESIPDEMVDRVYAAMALAPQHQFLNLSKRPERRAIYANDPATPFRIQKAMDALSVDLTMNGRALEWRSIARSPDYEVSNWGDVRSLKHGKAKVLSQVSHSGGYLQVALCDGGTARTVLIHSLVLTAFDRPGQEGEEVRHINGSRTDNRIGNLTWGSKAENMGDSTRHGTAGVWMKGRATFDAATVAAIRAARATGELLDDIAARFGSDRRQISEICLARTYKPAALQWPLANVWEGTSVENQATADERIPHLLRTPAAVRFLSCEPLLGPLDLGAAVWEYTRARGNALHWCIVGGESGAGARPFNIAWAEAIIEQCRAAGVACFYKQGGSSNKCEHDSKGGCFECMPSHVRVREFPNVV